MVVDARNVWQYVQGVDGRQEWVVGRALHQWAAGGPPGQPISEQKREYCAGLLSRLAGKLAG